MEINVRNNAIRNGFLDIFGNDASVEIEDDREDEIFVWVNGDNMFVIILYSDDDGFFYAYPFSDGPASACIRIAYPE